MKGVSPRPPGTPLLSLRARLGDGRRLPCGRERHGRRVPRALAPRLVAHVERAGAGHGLALVGVGVRVRGELERRLVASALPASSGFQV